MIIIKTPEEIEILREGGKRLAFILHEVKKKVRPGISTKELDDFAYKLIKEGGPARNATHSVAGGDEPAFLGYRPDGARFPYPASLCVSVNDEVVHGIPSEKKILRDGDTVSLDLGLKHKGFFTDMAITVPVGSVNKGALKLLEVTEGALRAGIGVAKGGNTVGDIGASVENFIRPHKYGIVDILSGHGVGKHIHEDPYVPNFGKAGTGEKLVPGMVIAIEPMVNEGTKKVTLDKDGYTFRTADGKKSAHFEHTILITPGEAEILTRLL